MRTLKGHLEFVPDDGYYFMLDDTAIPDDFEIVRLADGDTREPPQMTYMTLTVDEEQYMVDWIVEDEDALLAKSFADEPAPLVVCLGKFIPVGSSDEVFLKEQALAEEAARELEYYYKYESNEKLDITVYGYAIEYDGYCTPPLYAKARFDEFIDEYAIEIPFNNWHGWCGKSTRNVCGLATLNGNRGATYKGLYCWHRTIKHELGHNIGVLHCGTITDQWTDETEYGDKSALMGSGQPYTEEWVGQHLKYIGWMPNEKTLIVTSSKQVLLEPVELSKVATYSNAYQLVTIQEANQPDFTITIRKDIGTLYPQEDGDRVYVHRVDSNGAATKLVGDALKLGETKTLPSGTTIEFLEYENEVAKVEIRRKGDYSLLPEIAMPHGFPAIWVQTTPMERRHTGAWYDKKYNGQGFNLFVQGTTAVLFWYVYDAEGKPIYFVATGSIAAGIAYMTVSITSGGTFNNPSQRTETAVGHMQMYFTASDYGIDTYSSGGYGNGVERAVLLFDMPKYYGREATILEPVILAPDADSGAWWQPEMVGSGFGLMFYEKQTPTFEPNQKMCAGYWYTWDYDGKHRWFILIGEYDVVDEEYNLAIYEYFGGKWMYYTKPTEKPAGWAILKKQEDTGIASWKIIYDLKATNLDAVGEQVLTHRF